MSLPVPFQLYVDRLPAAVLLTLEVTIGATLIGICLGLLLAFARRSRFAPVSRLAFGLTYVLRALPLPPLLFLVYFAVLSMVFRINAVTAAVIALAIRQAPYFAEFFKAGLESVPAGVIEAAVALGMSSWRVRRRVQLPLAMWLVLPPTGQLMMGTMLDSSFVAFLGGLDITGMTRVIVFAYFSTELYLVLALTYLAIAFPVSRALAVLERRHRVMY